MHMRILFYIGIWLMTATIAIGQENKKEASKDEEAVYQSYKSRVSSQDGVDELLDDARQIKDDRPKEALDKVKEALGISLAQGNVTDEGRCYLLLGEINEGIEEWKLALENFKSAYVKLKSSRQYEKKAKVRPPNNDFKNAVRGLGTAHLKLGEYPQALQYFNEALKLDLTLAERAERQLDISEVYYQMGDYDRSLQTVNEIDRLKFIDESLEARMQNQRAKIYARTKNTEKAKDALELSQNTIPAGTTKPESKEQRSLKIAKEEVADVLHEEQRYDEEIDLRNKSITYNMDNNDLSEVTKDKVGLSKALSAKGETSAAIKELEEAVRLADRINNPKEQAKAFLVLADLYEKNERPDQALSTYKRYREAVKKTEEQNETRLIEKSELITKQKDIEELAKDVEIGQREETIARATVFRQQLIIYGLLLIILIIAVTSYFIYKNALASKTANQLLALKSLRSQMNPHFIFNALNSVNHFIAQNDERTANKFLSEFSRLMRLVLENSQEDFIPLVKEQEIISLYLKLEHYRFRDKFDYDISIEDDINLEAIEIPPMLVQPYIENAVWHGLRYKTSKGYLSLHIGKNTSGLKIEITDNGIGRKRSASLKTENQKKQNSTGLKNIQQRLNIINKVYRVNYNIEVADLDGSTESGTRVVIHLPIRKQTMPL